MCVYPPLLQGKIKDLVDLGAIEDAPTIYDVSRSSSKVDTVVGKVLDRGDNGRSKLVFCHYRGEIDAIKARLVSAGLHVETFDGRTMTGDRNRIITERCDVLILQIQTGCEGLNLQHFSEVYFVSPHWNPAVEDQAVARCHRIGQEHPVHVFRFEMAGFDEEDETFTIDAYAREVQDTKRCLMKMLDRDDDEAVVGQGECPDCPVCMEPIVDRRRLRCGHVFCDGCIHEIRGRDMLQACPVCRAPF
jgi:hypothetical protein